VSEHLVPTAERLSELQHRLADGLTRIDPYHRLVGRPVTYRLID